MYSVKLSLSLPIVLLIATLIFGASITSLAQTCVPSSDNSSSSVIHELSEIKTLIREESSSAFWSAIIDTILTILSIVVTVFVALRIYRLGEEERRKNIIRRSSETLLRELGEAIESFQRGERRHGSYYKEPTGQDPVIGNFDYLSEIIITDSYESILHSAFFIEFSTETQDVLSRVYDRIRTHNRLVLLIGQFETPTPKMLEYQIYLTDRESDIITLLHRSQARVRAELLTLSRGSGLKKALRLKGNPNQFVS